MFGDEQLCRLLIEFYHGQLELARDSNERTVLLTLIAEERARLADLTPASALARDRAVQ